MWKSNIFTLSMDGKNGLSRTLSGKCSLYTTTANKTVIALEVMMLISIPKIYQLKREYKFYILMVISSVFSSN